VSYPAFIGLDVHSQTIAVAVAISGRDEPEFRGEIANKPKSVAKLIKQLNTEFAGEVLLFCYEAGPCGYRLYRQILESGHECQVVAPSKIPSKPGERVKTDRRDALKLSKYLRSADLKPVWVPDEEQEAMRDLVRARGDFKNQEKHSRQQLNSFLLRYGHVWPSGKQRWTEAHFNWIESLKFPHPWSYVVVQEYIDAVKAATQRVAGIMAQIEMLLPQWSLSPVVCSLMALRGINKLTAITIMAELGDISRFDSPAQLMSYVGLVPMVHSSGDKTYRGRITRTGNSFVRAVLTQSAWTYRFAARQTKHIKSKAAQASEEAKAVSWKAQKRLCGRYRYLMRAGKNSKITVIAIARELLGFIWDIVCNEMPKLRKG
jgi:transposase